jgi:quercetin dioxygenase-like cupin family protein
MMLCHFSLKKRGKIPLHNHEALQTGYVISGKISFIKKDEDGFIAEAGTGYVFESEEYHGAEALEDSEVIECFTPLRPEYVD